MWLVWSWLLWVYEWVHHQASSSFWLDQALKLELLWYISYIPLILSIFVPINLFLILPVLSMASIFFHTHFLTFIPTTHLSPCQLVYFPSNHHSFPHHSTFIISYPYILSIRPIPILSTMFIFPHHAPSIPIFQLHHSAHFSHSFTLSPICLHHA